MHFAALKNPQESYYLKEKYFLTNVEGTRRLLAVMGDFSVNHLIFPLQPLFTATLRASLLLNRLRPERQPIPTARPNIDLSVT